METLIIDNLKFQAFKIPTQKTSICLIKANNGVLACAYVNMQIAQKIDDTLAIVTGIKNFDDMLEAKVISVSQKASDLGVLVGMTGKDALIKMS